MDGRDWARASRVEKGAGPPSPQVSHAFPLVFRATTTFHKSASSPWFRTPPVSRTCGPPCSISPSPVFQLSKRVRARGHTTPPPLGDGRSQIHLSDGLKGSLVRFVACEGSPSVLRLPFRLRQKTQPHRRSLSHPPANELLAVSDHPTFIHCFFYYRRHLCREETSSISISTPSVHAMHRRISSLVPTCDRTLITPSLVSLEALFGLRCVRIIYRRSSDTPSQHSRFHSGGVLRANPHTLSSTPTPPLLLPWPRVPLSLPKANRLLRRPAPC